MKKKNNKIIVSPELSQDDMKELLMSDEITDEQKKNIRGWIKEEQAKIDEEIRTCEPAKGIYGEYGAILRWLTPYNIWFRMACEKLLRDKHPHVYVVGNGKGRAIRFSVLDLTAKERNELMNLLLDTMKQIKDLYDVGYGRHGFSLEEVIEKLYEGSDDEKLIRKLSKKTDNE